ncbi:MAG: PqqD family protein [Thermoplasmata archaeon]|nr:MAG: PqqD family protein [Thermoplasmata archaeon]
MAGKKETKNILDMIPIRVYEWEEKETVSVKVPRFRSRLGQRFCSLIKKEPTYSVNLDKYGSFVWKLCDGKRTVREIGKALLNEYGEEVDPVYERVGELFNIMEANKLISYKMNNGDSDNTGGEPDGTD